ncbi:Gfo/Idh/MocA family protein [Paenibacillus koleovorans]|uniref:Gfo/Idh/MocA family protein n=1 Tax=Paenibacillus koleovorans TaxID=121608 RepID=UPI000FDBF731|nr:Gfo/Idh/MocA family oxidoreductase [Paenibacillus koleovorans]
MIGYKFMGKAHSHAYRDLPFYFDTEFEPVLQVLGGRHREAVEDAARKWGWREVETDWRRIMERKDIDIIDIVSPNNTHSDIVMAAAQCGKHIICEKPLAMDVPQAERMLQAVQHAGVKHMICFNYRFVPAVAFVKRLIEQGILGQLYHLRATFLQDWIMDPEFPLVWRLRREVCGSGALGDLMAHSIDLARYLIGEISEVSGMLETFIKKRPSGEMADGLRAQADGAGLGEVDVDDAAIMMARFDNGCLGVFEASRFAKGNRCGNRLEINGSKGSIRWDMEKMNELQLYLEDDPLGIQGFRTIHCTEEIHPYSGRYWPAGHSIGYEHTFINMVNAFVEAYSRNECPTPNFLDGFRCQQVLSAVETSSTEKRWAPVG